MEPGSTSEILPTHTPELFRDAVERAAALLRAGEVVAVPTETVYGLAANAFHARAVSRIFEVKGRPAGNPVIVHVAGLEMARLCALDWPETADRLAASFWPGPLTIVLRRSERVPLVVTAGGDTVGIRWPSHPFIQALIRACGFPLAAPSANPSERLSPTNAGHVRHFLGGRVPLIVDGGQSQVGIESTVVDLTGKRPRVLRPGMIHEESLLAAIATAEASRELGGEPSHDESSGVLRSPGLLKRHYAPRARLLLWSWNDEAELRKRAATLDAPIGAIHVIAHTNIPVAPEFGRVSVIPHDPEAFARALYAELHHCDEGGAKWIVVETPPETADWQAIRDRLQRAAADGGLQ